MGEEQQLRELAKDPGRLQAALAAADTTTLLLVLVQITGEQEWLAEARPFIQGPLDYQQNIPPELGTRIRERLLTALLQHARADRPLPPLPEGDLLQEMLGVAAGEPLDSGYQALMHEELSTPEAADVRGLQWRRRPPQRVLEDFHVVIVGAGMSGLCAAIRLKEAGIPFTIVEKNDSVGGTWYENRYPGCGVDTPNHFYSYSFAPNHDWSYFFAKREELWNYFESIADRYGLREHIRFRTEVSAAAFDERTGQWRITASHADDGELRLTANALFTAVGVLNRPKLPEIEGRETFAGPAFHTAEWNQSFDWRGKRVAMIGTGASGHQVGPSIAPDVEHLAVFQRSPHWAVPNPNYFSEVNDGKRWILAHLPYYARWYRFQLFWAFADGLYGALQVDPDWPQAERSLNQVNERHRQFMERHLRTELAERPDLIEKVTPSYPPYGKRILIDNHWFRMLKRQNVDLVTSGIDRIVPDGVQTEDGKVWKADALVFATGFHASRMLWPMKITGRDGKDLRDFWGKDDARAYLGTSVPGFPNLFIMMGPNTGLAHGGNQIFMTECQVRYAMLCLREMLENRRQTMEVTAQAYTDYNQKVDRMHDGMVWTHQGVSNWYRNDAGRVFAISPWRLVDFWRMTCDLDPADYHFE